MLELQISDFTRSKERESWQIIRDMKLTVEPAIEPTDSRNEKPPLLGRYYNEYAIVTRSLRIPSSIKLYSSKRILNDMMKEILFVKFGTYI